MCDSSCTRTKHNTTLQAEEKMPTKKEDLESLDVKYLVCLKTEASELLEQVYKQ